MRREELHDGWTVEAIAGPIPDALRGRALPATVPGSAHVDILAAEVIPNPYLDRTEADLTWTHRTTWQYTLRFDTQAPGEGEHVDLVFDGLDTVATIILNGQRLGQVANMHRGYRFDVRDALRAGANELVVRFAPALNHAESVEAELGWRPHSYPHPFNMVRKMACSFGWDWGPDLQTAGIWKPVRLERWDTARLERVRPLVTVDEDGTGRVTVHADVRTATGTDQALTIAVGVAGQTARGTVEPGQPTATVELTVPRPELWWPVGYGEQPLYELDVTLLANETTVDEYHRRIGFRTITVDTEPDDIGHPFTFVVNGTRVFARGANWIPDDHFLTRITRERLERRVNQAVGANLNMLRIWGGGIYETDDFYDVCDERGVLVWQDFPFACAAYPEEEPLWSEVEAEARENVARLTPHPSLALWNGNNENLWGFADWGWQDGLAGRTWGLGYYTELLPAIVAELDPTRHYSPGSPYSAGQKHPNDADHGTRHEWQVWNQIDYTHYRDHVPRFCSEFGFQGPPTWATLTQWIHDEPLTPTSPTFLLHQKAPDGNGKLDRGMAPHLPEPTNFADWHWATQLNQAYAVSFGIEHFRSWWPRTAGAIVWQLNDCWPVTSWAAIDWEERPKPLWYAFKHAFAPRLLTVQPRDGSSVLIAVNDSAQQWDGQVELESRTIAGEVVQRSTLTLSVPPRSVATVGDVEAGEVLVATTDETRLVHVFGEIRDLALDSSPLTAEVVPVAEGYRVDVTASALAVDVAVLADRVVPDAVVDDMLVTMLPGERRSFTVCTEAEVDPSAFTDPLVLRSANALHAATVES